MNKYHQLRIMVRTGIEDMIWDKVRYDIGARVREQVDRGLNRLIEDKVRYGSVTRVSNILYDKLVNITGIHNE